MIHKLPVLVDWMRTSFISCDGVMYLTMSTIVIGGTVGLCRS